jgi:hypothetical protein
MLFIRIYFVWCSLLLNAFNLNNFPQEKSELLEEGGWEYATAFSLQFRCKERKADLVRRRRWHRRMIQEDATAPAIFRRTGIDATAEVHTLNPLIRFPSAHAHHVI